jgi:predicted CoA-binding protein
VGAIPANVAAFLAGRRLAVAGVSRDSSQPANAIFRKLRAAGYEVYPVNPNALRVEGVECFPDVSSVPAALDGVVIVTPPAAAVDLVHQCRDRGIRHVWFHRSFGSGSVSEEAVTACGHAGIDCIVGGCPMMFCEPVDFGHKCMRWWLQHRGRVPA